MSACKRETIGRDNRLGRGRLDRRRRPPVEDFVNQAEFLGFRRGEEAVTLHALLDLLDRPAGVVDVELIEAGPGQQDFLGVDFDIRRLALSATGRLVDHDPGVGQRETLALLACHQQQRTGRRGLAEDQGRNVGPYVLHRVVDRQPRRHHATRRVDVEGDVLRGVLGLEIKGLTKPMY